MVSISPHLVVVIVGWIVAERHCTFWRQHSYSNKPERVSSCRLKEILFKSKLLQRKLFQIVVFRGCTKSEGVANHPETKEASPTNEITLSIMSSPMRWGDSDSSDEEAYVPSKKPQQEDDIHEAIADDPDDVEVVAEPAPTHRPRNDRGHNRHDQYHDSHRRGGNSNNYHNNDRSKGRSNRSQQRDRGGGGRGNHQTQRSGDWRAMAKSASRFSTGGG